MTGNENIQHHLAGKYPLEMKVATVLIHILQDGKFNISIPFEIAPGAYKWFKIC